MSGEEKNTTGGEKPTIKRTGMSGNAVAYGSSVIASYGGRDEFPAGTEVDIEETAMEGNAKAAFSHVRAAEERDLKIGGMEVMIEDTAEGNAKAAFSHVRAAEERDLKIGGKVTIRRTGMSGNAAAYGGSVIASHGGRDEFPAGTEVDIEETAMEGNAKAAFAHVRATEERDLKIGGETSGSFQEKTDSDRGKSRFFDADKTVILMVAGGGGDRTFLNDINEMKSKFISQFGIDQLNIHEVLPRGNQKQTLNNVLEQQVKPALQSKGEGYFIFYYAGHFRLDHTFSLVNTAGEHSGYKDEDLKKKFEGLPAPKMLFILDMCYSGGAVLGARGDDVLIPCLWDIFPPKTRGGPDDRQALQWCASSAKEKVGSDGTNGLFTSAVLQVMQNLARGAEVSVLDLHKEVLKVFQPLQPFCQPVLRPEEANTKPQTYFATFPKFVKC